jgi:hypothetical protein
MTYRTRHLAHSKLPSTRHSAPTNDGASRIRMVLAKIGEESSGSLLYLSAIVTGCIWATAKTTHQTGFFFALVFGSVVASVIVVALIWGNKSTVIPKRRASKRVIVLLAVMVGVIGFVVNDRFDSKREFTTLRNVQWDREFVVPSESRYSVVKVDTTKEIAASLGLNDARNYEEVIAKLRLLEVSAATRLDASATRATSAVKSVSVVSDNGDAKAVLEQRQGTLLLLVNAKDQASAQRVEEAAKKKFSVQEHPFYRWTSSIRNLFRKDASPPTS